MSLHSWIKFIHCEIIGSCLLVWNKINSLFKAIQNLYVHVCGKKSVFAFQCSIVHRSSNKTEVEKKKFFLKKIKISKLFIAILFVKFNFNCLQPCIAGTHITKWRKKINISWNLLKSEPNWINLLCYCWNSGNIQEFLVIQTDAKSRRSCRFSWLPSTISTFRKLLNYSALPFSPLTTPRFARDEKENEASCGVN